MDTVSAFPHDTDTTSEPNGFSIITPSPSTKDGNASEERQKPSTQSSSGAGHADDTMGSETIESPGSNNESEMKFKIIEQETGSAEGGPEERATFGPIDPFEDLFTGLALNFEKLFERGHADELMGVVTAAVERELGLHPELDVGKFRIHTLQGFVPFDDLDAANGTEEDPFNELNGYNEHQLPKMNKKKKASKSASLQDDLNRARILNNLMQCAKSPCPCMYAKKTSTESNDSLEATQTIDDGPPPISDLVDLAQAHIHHKLVGCEHTFTPKKEAPSKMISTRSVKRVAHMLMSVSVFLLCFVLLLRLYHTKDGGVERELNNASRRFLGFLAGQ
ncbi:hypothetical protein Q7P37_005430 [Cladosporium fusiforme]